MTGPEAVAQLAQGLSTGGLQGWIQDNVVPLILLAIAIILLWIGGRGDNAGVARRSVGLIVGLLALGIAVSGRAQDVGNFLAGLLAGCRGARPNRRRGLPRRLRVAGAAARHVPVAGPVRQLRPRPADDDHRDV